MLLLDVEPDILSPNEVKFRLNLVFQNIAVPMKAWGQLADWYVGTTAAEIELDTLQGSVTDFTPATTISVDNRMTETATRASSVTLKPAVAKKKKKEAFEGSLGELRYEAGTTRTFDSSYSADERELTPRCTRASVRWALRLPKGPKVTFDYIFGNVFLSGTAKWRGPRIEGIIRAKPSDIRFFTPDGPVTRMQSLSMRYAMFRQGISVEGEEGWSAAFKEVK